MLTFVTETNQNEYHMNNLILPLGISFRAFHLTYSDNTEKSPDRIEDPELTSLNKRTFVWISRIPTHIDNLGLHNITGIIVIVCLIITRQY